MAPALPALSYRVAPPRLLQVCEPHIPISEAELARIWGQQRYPQASLSLADGSSVEVIFPGRRNDGAGPDFRDACLVLNGKEQRGDVELHLSASGFQSHGHDKDLAYNDLILHVAYLADEPSTRLQSGRRVPVASFSSWVEQRAMDLRRWLEGPALWREPCHDVRTRLGDGTVGGVLRWAGERRFEQLVQRQKDQIAAQGEEQAFWQGLLDGLAFGGDRDGFRRLAALVPITVCRQMIRGLSQGQAEECLQQALLAAAGLSEGPEDGPRLTPRLSWPASRPANRPERRLGAAARLLARSSARLVSYAKQSLQTNETAALLDAWQVPQAGGAALLGQDRARELIVNLVLPFLVALDAGLYSRAIDLLGSLGAGPAYGKTRFLEESLAEASGRRPARRALEQQGLLLLYGEWCSKGGCGRCPLS